MMPTGFAVLLPPWLLLESTHIPSRLTERDDRLRLVNSLAIRNVEERTGGPFAAIVTDAETGALQSLGVNLVLDSKLSGMHSEMVALQLANRALGRWDLGARGGPGRSVLTTNAQPCLMCLGAVIWSGIGAIEYGLSARMIEELTGYDEGPMLPDWETECARRGIEVNGGQLTAELATVFGEYARRVASGEIAQESGLRRM
ncbi:nucleoside deaminase [Paeniglutamicibacter cryotolerans]|uniref:tRNA(Arg) A34 adenosine deaminase TadA n=1 Tax=Paeniglutamicibacter cryotolerans TaxID=670079 RepID=A0A839QEE0_9MICC|nr:nucleoside deaminase [Paeniglutamicibacter cryotolerans]MBB2994519.1 tRNA(Arg) A34 adenosine deaminase TadA [Paeniglutamicibacter cryotolerans]